MKLNKYITILSIYLIGITNLCATEAPIDQEVRKRPLVVVLHPIGHDGGMIANSEAGKMLSQYADILEPNASEHGYAKGLWFQLELGLWDKTSLWLQLRQAEAVLPGIQQFSGKLIAGFSQTDGGFMGGLKTLHGDSEAVKEATEKGYLDKLVDIISGPLASSMVPTVTKLDAYIERELQARKLTRSDLILCGISMGAIMALHYSLHHPEPCKAVIAINGLFVPPLPQKKASVPKNLLFVSGQKDEVIPYWLQKKSTDKLAGDVPHAEVFYSESEGHNGYDPSTEQFKKVQSALLSYLQN